MAQGARRRAGIRAEIDPVQRRSPKAARPRHPLAAYVDETGRVIHPAAPRPNAAKHKAANDARKAAKLAARAERRQGRKPAPVTR